MPLLQREGVKLQNVQDLKMLELLGGEAIAEREAALSLLQNGVTREGIRSIKTYEPLQQFVPLIQSEQPHRLQIIKMLNEGVNPQHIIDLNTLGLLSDSPEREAALSLLQRTGVSVLHVQNIRTLLGGHLCGKDVSKSSISFALLASQPTIEILLPSDSLDFGPYNPTIRDLLESIKDNTRNEDAKLYATRALKAMDSVNSETTLKNMKTAVLDFAINVFALFSPRYRTKVQAITCAKNLVIELQKQNEDCETDAILDQGAREALSQIRTHHQEIITGYAL